MRAILFSLLTFLLCACNSDIFVDDFTPDVTEVTMDGEHSTYTIHFKSDDWSTLTLASLNYDGIMMSMTVTPEGGKPSVGKTLEGDGSISVNTALTSLAVTRRGADVTVDVAYAIGNEPLIMCLEARSELTNDSHEVEVCINRVGGIEIVSVDYNLTSWGALPTESECRLLATYELPSGNAPVTWQPEFESGILAYYKISTATDNEEYLSALAGEKIPVPTRTNRNLSNWALRGETAAIGRYAGYTHLLHYPPLPLVTVQPGTVTSLNAEVMPTVFDATMRVKNIYSGEERDMIILLTIEQPEKYFVTSNEI